MDELLRLAEDPNAWAALATLIAMEVVLGLDNLVFIAHPHHPDRGTPSRPGAHSRPVAGARIPPRAARFGRLDGASDAAAGHGAGAGFFRARPLVAGRRVVPGLESDDRDLPPGRSEQGGWRRKPAGAARPDLRTGPDHHDRHRLLDRQHHHRRRHDRVFSDHGDRRRRGDRRDDGCGGAAGRVHPPQSHGADARAELPLDDRHDADRRRFRLSYRRGYIYAAMFFSSLVEALNVLARRKPRRST